MHPATPTCRPGLSPHAPYSVHTLLFRGCAELARAAGVPLATHLAETRAELELLRDRAGPFVPFLQGVGVWEPEGLAHDAAEVARLCSAAPRLLLVHGNYLAAEAVPHGATVVYCP